MTQKKLAVYVLVILLGAGGVGIFAAAPEARSAPNRELALAVPGWQQVNSSGFGDPQTREVSALAAFNGYLYAGTHHPTDPAQLIDGAQIFRSSNGITWTAVTDPGFGNSHDTAPPAILDLTVFNSYLYASTGRGNAAQIWRSPNGNAGSWQRVVNAGFGDPDIKNITVLAEYNGLIYVGATKQDGEAQIWRSFTGDGNLSNWTKVAAGTEPASVTGLAEFTGDGGLYAAVELESGAPAQIWRSYGGNGGLDWTTVISDGFGNSHTTMTGGLAELGGHLYAGAGNTVEGALLWRTNGVSWTQVITPGFGNANNQKVESLFVFQNQLYAGVKNAATGLEVWRSTDGTLWERANLDGFGDSHNSGSNGSNAIAAFLNHLYMGTSNVVDGGELWRKQNSNTPPTDISLTNSTVDENQPVDTVVGALSATDPNASETFTFSLGCAVAGADDGSFNILGTDLRTSAMFDFETKASYSICLRVIDQGGLPFDKTFVIGVNDLAEPPDIFLPIIVR